MATIRYPLLAAAGRILRRRPARRARLRGRDKADVWEARWSQPDFAPPWLGRGVSPEIVTAVDDGWFRPGVPALDVGCGQGDVVAWLARRGFPTVGVDIAPSAIKRARELFGEEQGRRQFETVDICAGAPPLLACGPYGAIVDRGCLHQIADEDAPRYARNLAAVSAPTGRMLLFHHAFRGGVRLGDRAERRRVTERVERVLSRDWELVRSEESFLDPFAGSRPEAALPGLVFWLERRAC